MSAERVAIPAGGRAGPVEAATISVARLPERDADVSVRAALGGADADRIEADIRANCEHEFRRDREREVAGPAFMTDEHDRKLFKASVLAGADRAGDGDPPRVERALRGLWGRVLRTAEAAAQVLPALRQRLDAAAQRLRDQRERHVAERAGTESVEALQRQRFWLRFALVGVWAAEFVVLVGSIADATGLDRFSLFGSWAQAFGLAGVTVIGTMMTAAAAARVLERLAGVRLVAVIAGVVVLVAAGALFVAVGALRAEAGQSDLAGSRDSVSEPAFVILVTVAPAVAAALGVLLKRKLKDVNERLAGVESMHRRQEEEDALLAGQLAALEREVARREAETRQPDDLRAAYEHGVDGVRQATHAHGLATKERVANAVAAFQQMSTLSSAERERVVASLYTLTNRTVASPASTTTIPSGVGASVSVVMVALAFASHAAGCAAPPPTNRIVIVDGTGPVEGRIHVGGTAFLQSAFSAWAREAVGRPESAFIVLPTAGSIADVQVAASIRVPERGRGTVRAVRRAWFADGLAVLANVPVPVDTPGDVTVNKSDVISAVVVAGRMTTLDLRGRTDLVIGTDGRQVGWGVNAERRVPDAATVRHALRAAKVVLDVSVFETLTVCGIHPYGLPAGSVSALDRFWRDILSAGGARHVVIRTTCVGLFPAAPLVPRDARPAHNAVVFDTDDAPAPSVTRGSTSAEWRPMSAGTRRSP